MTMSVGMICFLLLVGHAVCDYPLQGDTVALNKNRHAKTELQKHVPFYYWLIAHALMHGGTVALITGSVVLGVCETLTHCVIDFLKCEKIFNIHIDQALHFLCKIIWLVLWIAMKG